MPRAFGHKKAEDRREADYYPTPDRLAVACCRALVQFCPRPKRILEPSAGAGAFVRAVRQVWPDAHLTAVELRGEEHDSLVASGADQVVIDEFKKFLMASLLSEPVLVVGNPPYSLAQEHIMLLLDYLPPGSLIAFLLKLGFMGTKDRADLLWKQGQCHYIKPILGRPSFVKGGQSTSDVNEYGLFIWEVGYTGPTIVHWPHIRWKEKEHS